MGIRSHVLLAFKANYGERVMNDCIYQGSLCLRNCGVIFRVFLWILDPNEFLLLVTWHVSYHVAIHMLSRFLLLEFPVMALESHVSSEQRETTWLNSQIHHILNSHPFIFFTNTNTGLSHTSSYMFLHHYSEQLFSLNTSFWFTLAQGEEHALRYVSIPSNNPFPIPPRCPPPLQSSTPIVIL